jgi:hypothetical protein
MRSGAGGASVSTAVPILPPSCASRPLWPIRWAISAVVVDFPLVPVIAMNGLPGACARRSRTKISTSPMISTPWLLARSTVQCGLGWVSGTPGASTSVSTDAQSSSRRSATGIPAALAASTWAGLSSQAETSAPPATRDLAVANPEPPRPKSATRLPRNVDAGIIDHLSFSVARPIIASPTEMIQNRTTTWLSVHPSFSK